MDFYDISSILLSYKRNKADIGASLFRGIHEIIIRFMNGLNVIL